MRVYKIVQEFGSRHKDDKVQLVEFGTKKERTVTRLELKEALLNKSICVTNMKLTKTNRLVKVDDRVAWLNVGLVSYDVHNGICEVTIKSDEMEQINEFITKIERKVITEGCTDKGCSYGYKEGDKAGVHDVVVRWVHIDQVVRSLQGMPHIFALDTLKSARSQENFSYMTNEQFYMLVDYLTKNLNCRG